MNIAGREIHCDESFYYGFLEENIFRFALMSLSHEIALNWFITQSHCQEPTDSYWVHRPVGLLGTRVSHINAIYI